ncbi:MAG: helix-turn-helix domain-containing protein [Gemmataceae bacterium]
MPRPFASRVELSQDVRQQLQSLCRARSTPQALVFRCRIILLAATDENPSNQVIAAQLGCDRHTVSQWRERFVQLGSGQPQHPPVVGIVPECGPTVWGWVSSEESQDPEATPGVLE